MKAIAPDRVLIYIDDLNLFQGVVQLSAQEKGYRTGVPDTAVRINFAELITMARGKRELLRCKIYTSLPESKGPDVPDYVKVTRHKRSARDKEKQIDTSLTADAVEDIFLNRSKAGNNPTLVIFSGDQDFIPILLKAEKYDYKVEFWSAQIICSEEIQQLKSGGEGDSNGVYREIDGEMLKKVTSTEYEWKKEYFPSRYIVASVPNFSTAKHGERKWVLDNLVQKFNDLLKLPMLGKYLDPANENSKYAHIFIATVVTPWINSPRMTQQQFLEYMFRKVETLQGELKMGKYEIKIQTPTEFQRNFSDAATVFLAGNGNVNLELYGSSQTRERRNGEIRDKWKLKGCHSYEWGQTCPKGDSCTYAHGQDDFVCKRCVKDRRKYHTIKNCPYPCQ